MTLRQLKQAFGGLFRALRSIQQGIFFIMAQLDDLKAANAAEASAVADALVTLKLDAEQHAADLAALAARTAGDPDLSGLVADLNGRAASIAAAVAALHASVTAPAAAADSVAVGGTDTIASGSHDSVAGTAGDSLAGAASVAGADTVTAA